jgi:hypothetical protein
VSIWRDYFPIYSRPVGLKTLHIQTEPFRSPGLYKDLYYFEFDQDEIKSALEHMRLGQLHKAEQSYMTGLNTYSNAVKPHHIDRGDRLPLRRQGRSEATFYADEARLRDSAVYMHCSMVFQAWTPFTPSWPSGRLECHSLVAFSRFPKALHSPTQIS